MQKTNIDANGRNELQAEANDGQTAEENYSEINRNHSARQFEESPENEVIRDGESPDQV